MIMRKSYFLACICFLILICLLMVSFIYGTGETVTIVGDFDAAMMKFFDCTRSGPRSAFDSNVVYQFEIMEYVWILNPFVSEYSCFHHVFFCELLLSDVSNYSS